MSKEGGEGPAVVKEVSFECAAEVDGLCDELERLGYARDVINRLRDVARDVRAGGCGSGSLCRNCRRNEPAAEAAE